MDDLRERVAKEIFSHHFTPDESELDWYWNHKQWKQERDDCMAEADAILALVTEDRAALVAALKNADMLLKKRPPGYIRLAVREIRAALVPKEEPVDPPAR